MPEQPSSPAIEPYRRVVLKLSGESFTHAGERGIGMDEVVHIARQIQQAGMAGCEMAVVIGGGNILRGAQFKDHSTAIHEATAHYMGMLATVINGLALQDALESLGCDTRLDDGHPHGRRGRTVHSPPCPPAPGEGPHHHPGGRHGQSVRDHRHGRRAAGPGTRSRVLLKATRVDGVFSDDPEKNPHAVLYRDLTYDAVLERNLRVMDSTAIAQCREHNLPILVFNYRKEGNIQRAVRGEKVGTLIAAK